MWFNIKHESAVLFTLGICASAAVVPATTGANPSPNSLLAAFDIKLSESISIGNPKFTCKVFEKLFPINETFSPLSPGYTPLYEAPWSQTCWLKPACIVTPDTPSDLSKILLVLRVFKTKFATRSGGHSHSPGFSGVGDDGILVALQNLNTLSISPNKKSITIGTGNRWGRVYNFAAQNGVNVVGGRVPVVGVGGFLLGGGLSIFYNTHGLGMDQIVRYQVVLTSGKIVNATPTQNVDLYKALKGGWTNLGIVTEFEVLTNSDTDIYYEIYIYAPSSTTALLEAYGNYLSDPTTDVKSNVGLDISTNFTLAFYGYNAHTNRPKDFEPFYKIPTTSTIFGPTNGTVNDIISFGGSSTRVGNNHGSTYSHKVPDGKFMIESYQTYLSMKAGLPSDMNFHYIPQGVTPNLVTKGESLNGGNLFNLEATSQAWIDVFIEYSDIQRTALAKSTVDTFVSNITQKATAEGLGLPFLYPNNAGEDQKPLAAYGVQSLTYIKSMAKKYDPQGIMQTLQNDGYLVSTE